MDILGNRMQRSYDFFLNDKSNSFKEMWGLNIKLWTPL